ncbi:ethanolamine ammonia-lyase subunit EutC [Paracidovorax cattleyae]|uniref:Ethanolamine ammonia-lyase small subunit n=1 Tax=Paracidovorax cattleyae TaxID=80868 RepID=A0A1H0TFY9_9BURK|nr:ethanolamine ammonia-lyase subunit EutC [Paracidovorax cattleyae]AVS76179.1 ethanolamine ammonia-lyase subunit EutC [Paracidovorax cattleyae]SDP52963.1 Ethanolamine ammonia-lyase light chain [Paracidovorax cattleyae]
MEASSRDDRTAGAAPAPMPAATGTPPSVTAMPWHSWRQATPARIALGRAGVAIPTDEALRFGWAHAMARDAIHAPLDAESLAAALRDAGHEVLQARSRAEDRATYLRRPDLGRQLHPEDAMALQAHAAQAGALKPTLCVVVGDGLSSLAVQRHAVPLLQALAPLLPPDATMAPVVVLRQARVAVADEVGELLGASLSAMLIGERPGLSSPDSLGIYLTHAPRRGRSDAERNCISNVRAEGLSYAAAAFKLAWLMRQARRLGVTGVALKDDSDAEWALQAPRATTRLGDA